METKNNLVWARMKYCPYWPARIVETPPEMGRTPKNKICVLFFGAKQFGFVDVDKVLNYTENRAKYVSKGKGASFTDAVKKMDDYITDPVKYKSNAYVNQITIKTEENVEHSLGIKRETVSNPTSDSKSSPTNTQLATTPFQEKQSLIDKIVALTSENQEYTFKLNQAKFDFN